MSRRHGMTLVEMLVAMTVFLGVLATAVSALGQQSRGFTRGADEMGILQNLRYGVQQLEQEVRAAGANTADRQPPVAYAGNTAFAFNADLVSNVVGDISAVYVDPDAPAGHVSGMTTGMAGPISGSSPVFSYPLANYVGGNGFNTAAETITFWFDPDPETARADDFVLLRRVNNRAPETLVRNILAPVGNLPFFRYRYLNEDANGVERIDTVPTAWLPLRHTSAQHGQLPDTGVTARIDQLRSVEVRYRVTNGRAGADERIREIATIIPLANMGLKKLKTCGDEPLFSSVVTATPAAPSGQPPRIDLAWGASVDEAAGERDVIRYVVWRRLFGSPDWGDPYTSVPSGAPPYLFSDVGVTPGSVYQYAVAAQDCTPNLSPLSVTASVTAPLPTP